MAKKDGELTPMMKQFFDLKAKHPDAVMLFRCGDFYETYCEDAITAAKILGITLTHRNNGAGVKGDEMAGFPHHALDTYLPKLIRAGKRVAICDQLEDPKLTKKLVKRGITELVTPGVAMSDNVLNYKENNFLAAVHFGKASYGVAFLDISTGEFLTGEGTQDYVEKLLGNFSPKEVLHDRNKKQEFERSFGTKYFTFQLDDWVFTEQTSKQKLLRHFNVKNLKGFGVDHLQSGIIAAGAILQMIHTKTLQVLHIEVAQQLLLGSLFRKHPVIELESKVFCTEVTLKLLFLRSVMQNLLRREITQELFHIVLRSFTCQELTCRDIEEGYTKGALTKVNCCQEVVFLIVQHIITQGHTRCHKFCNTSFYKLFREFRVFELITDCDTLTSTDQFWQIGVKSMMGEARHLVAFHTSTIISMGEGDT